MKDFKNINIKNTKEYEARKLSKLQFINKVLLTIK